MARRRHVALLRGINVGGSNIIKMVDLRARFEALGFVEVETYIQSGNVVFTAPGTRAVALAARIEEALQEAFGYGGRVVVVSAATLERVVAQAPAGFGSEPDAYRYDVVFVVPPVRPGEVLRQVSTQPGVDEVHAGDHALYFRRLIVGATRSHLPKLIQQPVYRSLTIRNWRTTTRLLAMAAAAAPGTAAPETPGSTGGGAGVRTRPRRDRRSARRSG